MISARYAAVGTFNPADRVAGVGNSGPLDRAFAGHRGRTSPRSRARCDRRESCSTGAVRATVLFPCAALVLGALACKASNPDDTSKYADAGVATLTSPRVEAPDATPLTTVALRGVTAGASRVVVKPTDVATSQVQSLLPGGSFCVDAPLPQGGTRTFEIYAISEQGVISDPTRVSVEHDAAAPEPANALCTAASECGSVEICDNGIDDDCNAFKDGCDPGCNGCVDDFLEPNDTPFDVPILQKGVYENLVLCPCRDDWFAFAVQANQRLRLTASFTHALIDIDLRLYKATDAENQGAPVASSVTTTNIESIDYTPTAAGVYYLRVYAFNKDKANGSYKLTVQ
jgi:hypothetical protein